MRRKFRHWLSRNRIYRNIMGHITVRIFGEVSTSTFSHKEAGTITLFDAYAHYRPDLGSRTAEYRELLLEGQPARQSA